MSYEERAFKYCQECKFFKECCWSLQGRYADCIDGHTFMDGWEAGQKDTLEEIENVLSHEHYRDYCRTNYISDENQFFCSEIVKKIKELKEDNV